MLVHIPTMGVLVNMWFGEFDKEKSSSGAIKEYPRYVPCTFKNVYLDNPDQWQEIDTKSALGKKILKYYPDVLPVCDESGILVDIIVPKLEENKKERELKRQELKKEAESRGYKNKVNIRPKNLLPFLQLEPHDS